MGEISPKHLRIDPMNQDASFLPRRGNGFSLSPRERAGVRVSVKLIIPSAFTRTEMHYYYPHLTQPVHGEGERQY